MTQEVRITYYGMEGVGKNVTEAKRDAGSRIEEALKGDHEPVIIGDLARYAALLFRTPQHGWTYAVLAPDTKRLCAHLGIGNSRENVERHARNHLANLLDDVSLIDGKRYPADVTSWQEKHDWQVRMKELLSQGYSDNDARLIAGGMGHLVKK